jgi:hypothetical protein
MSMVRGLREQLPGDLAVGAPDRDKAQHFELTSRRAGVLKLARRPSAESALDPLAEPGELLGRGGAMGRARSRQPVGGRRPARGVRRVRRGCPGKRNRLEPAAAFPNG